MLPTYYQTLLDHHKHTNATPPTPPTLPTVPTLHMHYGSTTTIDEAAHHLRLPTSTAPPPSLTQPFYLLDIGSGFGEPARYLLQTYSHLPHLHIDCVEIDPQLHQAAQERTRAFDNRFPALKASSRIRHICSDIVDFLDTSSASSASSASSTTSTSPHPHDTYQGILCMMTLLHLSDDTMVRTLRGCAARLSDNGRMLIEDFHRTPSSTTNLKPTAASRQICARECCALFGLCSANSLQRTHRRFLQQARKVGGKADEKAGGLECVLDEDLTERSRAFVRERANLSSRSQSTETTSRTQSNRQSNTTTHPSFTISLSNAQWKHYLPSHQYRILREKETEPQGLTQSNGGFLDHFRQGIYVCYGCNVPLYTSSMKTHSSSGWPSFHTCLRDSVYEAPDEDGSGRMEIMCASCGGHLGHVFRETTPPKEHHCVNSGSLIFVDRYHRQHQPPYPNREQKPSPVPYASFQTLSHLYTRIQRLFDTNGLQVWRTVWQRALPVPRMMFVPRAQKHLSRQDHPLTIGYQQTISAPHIHRMTMTSLRGVLERLTTPDRHCTVPAVHVLDIGCGSGYVMALMCEVLNTWAMSLVHPPSDLRVVGIEIVPELVVFAKRNMCRWWSTVFLPGVSSVSKRSRTTTRKTTPRKRSRKVGGHPRRPRSRVRKPSHSNRRASPRLLCTTPSDRTFNHPTHRYTLQWDCFHADGHHGYPALQPYAFINVGAMAQQSIPKALQQQVIRKGRILIPVHKSTIASASSPSTSGDYVQWDATGEQSLGKVTFVPLVSGDSK